MKSEEYKKQMQSLPSIVAPAFKVLTVLVVEIDIYGKTCKCKISKCGKCSKRVYRVGWEQDCGVFILVRGVGKEHWSSDLKEDEQSVRRRRQGERPRQHSQHTHRPALAQSRARSRNQNKANGDSTERVRRGGRRAARESGRQ